MSADVQSNNVIECPADAGPTEIRDIKERLLAHDTGENGEGTVEITGEEVSASAIQFLVAVTRMQDGTFTLGARAQSALEALSTPTVLEAQSDA